MTERQVGRAKTTTELFVLRIRITRAAHGDVDGIRLAAFQVGQIYDVSPSLATYLIMMAGAEPVADPTTPVSEHGIGEVKDPSRDPIY